MNMEFNFDSKEVESNLSEFGDKAIAALAMYSQTAASYLESQAKENRPWTDRTGHARQGLTGSYEVEPSEISIVLAHTVDYGLWLELAHEKNYAIVDPTVTLHKDSIIQGLQGLFDKIKV